MILANRLDCLAERLGLDLDELAALQTAVLPEEFGDPPTAPHTAPTGTFAKVNAMCHRARARLPLMAPGDAPPIDGRGLSEFILVISLNSKTRKKAMREARQRLGETAIGPVGHHFRNSGITVAKV